MTTEKAIEMCKSIKHYLTGGNPVWSKEEVADAMTMAIEALQVDLVRCGECRHNGSYDTDCPISWARNSTDYCSYGERSER